MKSRAYKFGGKVFRYDYDEAQVELIYKASAEDIKEEQDWIKKHGRPLLGIDEDGYTVVTTVGLSVANWKNKEARNEYLSGWIDELDEEARILAAQYLKWG